MSPAAPAGQLRADDVSFAYVGAARAALRHVNLGVAPGEVVLITGASGCGKSTLALALCGLIPSRVHGELRGRVMFGTTPLSGMRPHEASQLVGMVFQNPNLQLINQTVQSEVAFGPENLALPQPEIAARVDWCLDVTGMAGMRTAAVVTLSGGQKQRTAIAATLAMRPRILVLDEPLSDLDPVGAQEVLATLRRLARGGGTSVIIIEHRVDEVAPWADRVVLMDDGRVVLDQPPHAAWAEPGPWRATGVGIPDLVRLAHAVPGAFGPRPPLSVEEAASAVKDTWFEAALAAAAAERRTGAGVPTGRPPGHRNGAAAGASPAVGAGADAGPPVLSWDGVSVEFDGKPAVDDVTLAVHKGEWVALIGANGSGKSTLTGLTVGLGKPSAGVVRFRGQPVRPGKVFDHAAQVALLLQAADDMLFETTVRKELGFGFRFRARPKEPVLGVAEAVEFFGFTGQEEDSPWELSQGGRQRLALAALLVGAPGVLVLDEPTTGQDAEHMRAFLRLLDRVRARTGITIVTVTHDIRGLASRAARVVLLGEGQVRADGPASRVFAMTGDLIRWGVLAPPLARLQSELLGPTAGDVLLEVDELASAALAHRPERAGAASRKAGGAPAVMHSLLVQTIIAYVLIFAVPMLLPVVFLKVVGLSGLRTLVTYEARDTPLHKLDPRLKVLYPVGMGILSILFTWKFMLLVFGLTILPWFWLRPSRAKIKVLMVMIIGPAIAGFWGQGLYYLPPPPIHFLYKFPWTMAWLGSPGITTYGMIFGLQQTSRVLVTVSTSMLILVSTDVGDFTWAFERFRAPPHVGFALTAALRFLPEMITRTNLVFRAVELRGYDMSRPRWHQFSRWPDYAKRLSRCVVLVTVPLLIGTLRGTTTMAMVADARGFGAAKRRGSLRAHKTTAVDIWGYAILAVLVAGALVLNHLGIGARYYG